MPLAQIDDKGTSVYYEDSGAPDGSSTYTTVVMVHGLLINSATFDRMLPLASKYGLRIITMNSRDYRDSTPYTAEELSHMTSPDLNVQASAVRRWGREVALFLAYVCQTLRVPAIAGEGVRKEGGLVLTAWSLSGITILSILGDSQTLGSDLTAALAPYLRKVVLYDSPAIIFGVTADIGLTWPYVDDTIPPERKPDAFVDWASSYNTVLPEGVPITAEALRKHYKVLPRTPTLRTLPTEEFKRTVNPEVSTRSALIMGTDDSIRQKYARRTFSDADAVFPDVDVLFLWCDQSVWLTAWGAKIFQDLVAEAAEPGKKKRKTAFLRVKGVNHLVSPL
ncbi:uncharacterized protein PHACADRAFT_130381 [Phanerochaete carnosa HHB-10118-sp]|uniref:AB hydrolase-1 domain-containing protein n=1 Tax=Phanerochaete carnosa (strain HHB-10118-sp) TaxID=650164 RepID=K5UK38_PHACS|nr:uncharacterized protein PHACADRAFT_130381 [Phanerochaete carnosa HHB-10118-sp]EKM49951.1 hypothetical protein PHACADRAFT_130381 [Phanerochaete carnosa HHB-10118-sp]